MEEILHYPVDLARYEPQWVQDFFYPPKGPDQDHKSAHNQGLGFWVWGRHLDDGGISNDRTIPGNSWNRLRKIFTPTDPATYFFRSSDAAEADGIVDLWLLLGDSMSYTQYSPYS